MNIIESLYYLDEDIVICEDNNLDSAIVGFSYNKNEDIILVYDEDRCIDIIQTEYGFSKEEAEEHFANCVVANCIDERSPIFIKVIVEYINN